MDKLLSAFRQNRFLNTIFTANVFVSLHYALIIYVNSSFLSQFFSQTQVSSLYIIGSLINTYLLLNISKILEKIGLYKFIVYSIGIEFLSTFGMFVSTNHTLIAFYFLIELINISLLLFGMDVLIQCVTQDTSKTGGVRAMYMTITNFTIMISPMIVAVLLAHNVYSHVYLLSTLFVVPMYFYMTRLRELETPSIRKIKAKETIVEYAKDSDLNNVYKTRFLLQLFYAFMVIYTPIYMNKVIGFPFSEIGLIFTIMLVPFILFELPVGELADDKYGEKEFLTIGFAIMALSTIILSFITAKNFWIWAIALFVTRVGASFVEISSDTYFFKKITSEKSDVISFYRTAQPLAYVLAPVIATIVLQFIAFQYLFIVVGGIMILGARYALALNDTK